MYIDPAFYATLTGLAKVSAPEVVSTERTGDRVRLKIRYTFTADLPAAALAVLDPHKLTWIDDTTYDLAELTSTTKLLPDHYADRFTAVARSAITSTSAEPPRSTRDVEGDLNVRMPFVGGQVERALVSGLREHLQDEERLAARWLASRR